MHTIQVFLQGDQWQTRHSDPMVRSLFGTDVLPTPYSSTTSECIVLAQLREKNPDREIIK